MSVMNKLCFSLRFIFVTSSVNLTIGMENGEILARGEKAVIEKKNTKESESNEKNDCSFNCTEENFTTYGSDFKELNLNMDLGAFNESKEKCFYKEDNTGEYFYSSIYRTFLNNGGRETTSNNTTGKDQKFFYEEIMSGSNIQKIDNFSYFKYDNFMDLFYLSYLIKKDYISVSEFYEKFNFSRLLEIFKKKEVSVHFDISETEKIKNDEDLNKHLEECKKKFKKYNDPKLLQIYLELYVKYLFFYYIPDDFYGFEEEIKASSNISKEEKIKREKERKNFMNFGEKIIKELETVSEILYTRFNDYPGAFYFRDYWFDMNIIEFFESFIVFIFNKYITSSPNMIAMYLDALHLDEIPLPTGVRIAILNEIKPKFTDYGSFFRKYVHKRTSVQNNNENNNQNSNVNNNENNNQNSNVNNENNNQNVNNNQDNIQNNNQNSNENNNQNNIQNNNVDIMITDLNENKIIYKSGRYENEVIQQNHDDNTQQNQNKNAQLNQNSLDFKLIITKNGVQYEPTTCNGNDIVGEVFESITNSSPGSRFSQCILSNGKIIDVRKSFLDNGIKIPKNGENVTLSTYFNDLSLKLKIILHGDIHEHYVGENFTLGEILYFFHGDIGIKYAKANVKITNKNGQVLNDCELKEILNLVVGEGDNKDGLNLDEKTLEIYEGDNDNVKFIVSHNQHNGCVVCNKRTVLKDILDLLIKIKFGLPEKNFYCLFSGDTINENKTLSDIRIKSGSYVLIYERDEGSSMNSISNSVGNSILASSILSNSMRRVKQNSVLKSMRSSKRCPVSNTKHGNKHYSASYSMSKTDINIFKGEFAINEDKGYAILFASEYLDRYYMLFKYVLSGNKDQLYKIFSSSLNEEKTKYSENDLKRFINAFEGLELHKFKTNCKNNENYKYLFSWLDSFNEKIIKSQNLRNSLNKLLKNKTIKDSKSDNLPEKASKLDFVICFRDLLEHLQHVCTHFCYISKKIICLKEDEKMNLSDIIKTYEENYEQLSKFGEKIYKYFTSDEYKEKNYCDTSFKLYYEEDFNFYKNDFEKIKTHVPNFYKIESGKVKTHVPICSKIYAATHFYYDLLKYLSFDCKTQYNRGHRDISRYLDSLNPYKKIFGICEKELYEFKLCNTIANNNLMGIFFEKFPNFEIINACRDESYSINRLNYVENMFIYNHIIERRISKFAPKDFNIACKFRLDLDRSDITIFGSKTDIPKGLLAKIVNKEENCFSIKKENVTFFIEADGILKRLDEDIYLYQENDRCYSIINRNNKYNQKIGLEIEQKKLMNYNINLDKSGIKDIIKKYTGKDKVNLIMFIHGIDTKEAVDVSYLFARNYDLISVVLNQCNFSDMTGMFSQSEDLKLVDFRNVNTQEVKDFNLLFFECKNLKYALGLDNLNTKSIINMLFTFAFCEKLVQLNGTDKWNLSNLERTDWMFVHCHKLLSVSISNPGRLISIAGMFFDCQELEFIEGISEWNVEKVFDMYCAFHGCRNLRYLDLSKWINEQTHLCMCAMFSECIFLKEVNLSGIIIGQGTDINFLFSGCNNLEEVIFGSFTLPSYDGETLYSTNYIFFDSILLRISSRLRLNTHHKKNGLRETFSDCWSLERIIANKFELDKNKIYCLNGAFKNCYKLTDPGALIRIMELRYEQITDYLEKTCYNTKCFEIATDDEGIYYIKEKKV